MKLDWTKHLKNSEEKTRFENLILGSRPVIERLNKILEEYEKSLNRSETDLTTYETPNWDYRQAHKNGYRACLYRIQELLNLDQRTIKLND
jgi:hypothetical protein